MNGRAARGIGVGGKGGLNWHWNGETSAAELDHHIMHMYHLQESQPTSMMNTFGIEHDMRMLTSGTLDTLIMLLTGWRVHLHHVRWLVSGAFGGHFGSMFSRLYCEMLSASDIQYFAGEPNLNFSKEQRTTTTVCYLVLAYLWFVAISRGDTSFITFSRRRRHRRHKHWPWKRFSRTQNRVTLAVALPECHTRSRSLLPLSFSYLVGLLHLRINIL